jgi:hypothetical protein
MKALSKAALFTIFFFRLLSASALAEIYQWRDDNGQLHFTDQPLNVDKHEVLDFDVSSNFNSATTEVQPEAALEQANQLQAEREAQRKAEREIRELKKARALRDDHAKEKELKRAQQCSDARQLLGIFDRKSYTDTSLEALKKRRLKRGRLKSRIEKYCR